MKKAMFQAEHQYEWNRVELLWFFVLGVGVASLDLYLLY